MHVDSNHLVPQLHYHVPIEILVCACVCGTHAHNQVRYLLPVKAITLAEGIHSHLYFANEWI